MASPVPTARPVPTGMKLDDGHSTVVAFSQDPGIGLWEKTVKPPGVDGGEAIDTSTMHTQDWRAFAPRKLKTLTEGTMTCAYDPAAYDSLVGMVNVVQTLTVHFPDGSNVAFFGFLRNFDPADNAEGTQPTATCAFTPTNVDPSDGSEAGPFYTAPGATTTTA